MGIKTPVVGIFGGMAIALSATTALTPYSSTDRTTAQVAIAQRVNAPVTPAIASNRLVVRLSSTKLCKN